MSSADANRKTPEYGELKSFEDQKAIKRTLKQAGKTEGDLPEGSREEKQKREGKGFPAAQGAEAGAGKKDAGAGKQDRMPGKSVPASRPQAAPARR